jgi:predicted SAM-dependent methyltransferase
MRWQTKEFVQKFLKDYGGFKDILDVGSMDINGNVKGLFPPGWYKGIDMREGPNVDIVMNSHDLVKKFGPKSFDVVICFDTLEHDEKFWITVSQMKKVLRSGGWLLMGAPGRACPLHDFPGDYWRFMPESFTTLLNDMKNIHVETEMQPGSDIEASIYGYGQKA